MNLARRLESLEIDLTAERLCWCEDFDFALRAAGTSEEVAAFARALSRSLGEIVVEGDAEADERVATDLYLRTPQEIRDRGDGLFPMDNSGGMT